MHDDLSQPTHEYNLSSTNSQIQNTISPQPTHKSRIQSLLNQLTNPEYNLSSTNLSSTNSQIENTISAQPTHKSRIQSLLNQLTNPEYRMHSVVPTTKKKKKEISENQISWFPFPLSNYLELDLLSYLDFLL